ncbi:MAG: ABC transporter ATP-binding protein [Gammaproteobacteria bacterium]|nr:ABC transporter ATP-binding protein [Gammaproteobacteria bacterium]
MMAFIELHDVVKNYVKGSETVHVLQNLSLSLEQGEFLALMGPSGSGKSTLLNLIGGIDTPSSGTVSVAGSELSTMSSSQLARWRSETIGFVFQFYNLLPFLTAQRNVELPLLLTNLGGKQRKENSLTALRTVSLEDRSAHKPGELSGGQQQRVAIARAIVADPQILVCDEPTGDLDRQSAREILDLLTLLNEEFGKTVIIVTHDPIAAEQAQRTLHLDKGILVENSEGEQAA